MSDEESQIADQTLEFIRNLIKNEQKGKSEEVKLLQP